MNRRTLLLKQSRVMELLEERDKAASMSRWEKAELDKELRREIASIWETDELRRTKPTPVEEAMGGLYVVEQSLWDALPRVMRRLDYTSEKLLGGRRLPLPDPTNNTNQHAMSQLQFGSWMGGDRDGNPNVTPEITLEIALLSRWGAADLILRDIRKLRLDLSVSSSFHRVSPAVALLAMRGRAWSHVAADATLDESQEPYRDALRCVEGRIRATRLSVEKELKEARKGMAEAGSKPTNFTRPFPFTSGGNDSSRGNGHGGAGGGGGGKGGAATKAAPYHSKRELLEDLLAMHSSLTGSWRYPSSRTDAGGGMCWGAMTAEGGDERLTILADGPLLDTIRRVDVFGLTLLPLDMRQDSARHTEALDQITASLGMESSYGTWGEQQRQNWLLRELESSRPLIVPSMLHPGTSPFSAAASEVLRTFRVAAELGPESVNEYIISMAKRPSDVLAVELLRRKVAQGCLEGGDNR